MPEVARHLPVRPRRIWPSRPCHLPLSLLLLLAGGPWAANCKRVGGFCVCGTGTGCRLVSAFDAAHGVRYHCISTLDTTDEEEAFIAAVLSLNLPYP